MMAFEWLQKNVLITGGASFIGSALTKELVSRGAKSVIIIDDLSSGKVANIQELVASGIITLHIDDVRYMRGLDDLVKGSDIVFHLSAFHGGRGIVATKDGACAGNFFLDGRVLDACLRFKKKVVFASSGCIYPSYIQNDVSQSLFLKESDAGPPFDPDNSYGAAKLIAEQTLRAFYKDFGLPSVSLRFFTVFGPGVKPDHAVGAMIARSFIKQNPFEIFGTGEQLRNWTYLDDIISGMILAAEKINDGRAINLGTMERTSVIDAARYIMDQMGHKAEIRLRPDLPSGPLNRIADNSLAKQLLGWEPKISFKEGVQKTIEWYIKNHNVEEVKRTLERSLFER